MTTEAIKTPAPKPCQWCGCDFHSDHHAKLFCTAACKTAFNNATTVIGRRIAAEAMAWRRARGGRSNGGAAAFQRLCCLLDEANAEYTAMRPKKAPSINDYIIARNGKRSISIGKDRTRRAVKAEG
jgi:hypothetical protein